MKLFLRAALGTAVLAGWMCYGMEAWGQSLSFSVAPVFPAGTLPTSIAAGNLNGDIFPDIAVTNQNGVSILLNDGNGGFQPAVSYAVGTNPQSVAIHDFNGDGKSDLAVVNQGSGTVSILLGNGNGTFQTAVSYPAGNNPRSVLVADFNGDGKDDLAIVDSGFATGSGVSILLGNGNGTFQTALFTAAGSVSLSATAGDFNGDSKTDLAVANSGSDNVSVLLGNGNGTFAPAVNYNLDRPGLSVSPVAVVSADFNSDGKRDLAVTTPNVKEIAILAGIGNGTFQSSVHYSLDDPNFVNNNNALVTVDLNQDGKADLILGNLSADHVTVLLGGGDGTFPASLSYAAGPEPIGLAVADFNVDGSPDIAVADNAIPGEVALLLGNGDGTLQAAPLYRSGSIPDILLVGDLNGDGKLDLVTASHFGSTAGGIGSGVALLGTGNGGFQAPAIWATAAVTGAVLGDFNHDGKLDLAVTDPTPGGSGGVLLGKGDGTFQAPLPFTAGTSPQAIAAADLNGDGKLDVVVGNHGSNNVSVLLGVGDGTLLPAVNYQTPTTGTPDAIAVADFNHDGKLDLAVAISGINATTVSILLGNGDGTFQPQLTQLSGFASSATLRMVTDDFNGDHIPDLAVTDGATLAILIGNGSGLFQTPVTSLLVGAGKAINGMVVSGDFNGDSVVDLAATSRDGISVLLGNGNGSFQAPVTYDPFIGGAVAAADFDGDGRTDLVAADSSQDSTPADTVAILRNGVLKAVSVTVTSSPPGLAAVIDSGANCTTPCTVTLNWGTVHKIDIYAVQYGPGTEYVFASWSDGGGIGHFITVPGVPVTYTAQFTTKYVLTCSTSPAPGGVITPGSGSLFVAGTVVSVVATPTAGYVFTGWTGNVANAGSASTTVTMNGPQTLVAAFTALPGVTIQTSPPGLQFSVDSGAAMIAPQTLNLSQGGHQIAVSTTQAGTPGTQYVFAGWSDNGAASHNISVDSNPANYTAFFKTQYQLTVSASPAAEGTVSPVSGNYYDASLLSKLAG